MVRALIRTINHGLATLTTLLIAGCASTNVGSDYFLESSRAEGLLVVSVSEEGLQPSESTVWSYRNTDGSNKGEIIAHTLRQPVDWTSPAGRLVYIRFVPGRYEFYDAGFARQTSGATTYWTTGKNGIATNNNPNYAGFNVAHYSSLDAKPFRVSFEIVAGQATYLGNLYFVWDEAGQRGEVMVRDEAVRDLALLQERLPRISAEQIRAAVPLSSRR